MKKPRSLSEGESHSNSENSSRNASNESSSETMSNSASSSGESINDQKKTVKFNKEIKRTLFKSGSAVAGTFGILDVFPLGYLIIFLSQF